MVDVINVGIAVNDGSGDPIRTAFQKVNANFASVSAVGYSGAYADLSGRPVLGTAAAQASGAFATATQGATADSAVQPAGLSAAISAFAATLDNVATSGSYNDLSDKPLTNPTGGTAGYVLTKIDGVSGNYSWQLAVAAPSQVAILEDQKAAGSGGGASTGTAWNTRTLNNENDPSAIVSLASNQFTPAYDCWCEFSAPAYASERHQARIWNVTDSVVAIMGEAAFALSANQGSGHSRGFGGLAAGKTYRLEQYFETGGASGLGISNSAAAGIAVFSRVMLWRK